MSTYTIQSGDDLSAVARQHGFASWQALYFHPDNAGFRRVRPKAGLVFPGDIVIIPKVAAPDAGSGVHPGLKPGPSPMKKIVDDKCCYLATDKECSYKGAKSNYTCSKGYVKHHWVCTEGSRKIGCGECAKSPSQSCWSGPFECSIWWWM